MNLGFGDGDRSDSWQPDRWQGAASICKARCRQERRAMRGQRITRQASKSMTKAMGIIYWRCPKCNRENAQGYAACPRCGTPRPMIISITSPPDSLTQRGRQERREVTNTIYINTARHGSLQNAMLDQTHSVPPEVGMGVTEVLYSDRHPFTVIKILTQKRIVVQSDHATRIDTNGCSESQEYRYETDQHGCILTLFLNKQGKWKELGNAEGSTFLIGIREEYYDFSR